MPEAVTKVTSEERERRLLVFPEPPPSVVAEFRAGLAELIACGVMTGSDPATLKITHKLKLFVISREEGSTLVAAPQKFKGWRMFAEVTGGVQDVLGQTGIEKLVADVYLGVNNPVLGNISMGTDAIDAHSCLDLAWTLPVDGVEPEDRYELRVLTFPYVASEAFWLFSLGDDGRSSLAVPILGMSEQLTRGESAIRFSDYLAMVRARIERFITAQGT